MIIMFVIALFTTLLIVRILAHSFHDMKNYGTKNERSKTITGWLRRKTGFDWHHFHFGLIILIIATPLIAFKGFTTLNTILLGAGFSMFIDQTLPMYDRKRNYFHTRSLLISILEHIIITIAALMLTIA